MFLSVHSTCLHVVMTDELMPPRSNSKSHDEVNVHICELLARHELDAWCIPLVALHHLHVLVPLIAATRVLIYVCYPHADLGMVALCLHTI